MICILGIETSFDDTSIAIYNSKIGIIFNKIITHKKINKIYGGIIPNLSSKLHLKYLLYLIKKYILVFIKNIDYIAYTAGPGLKGCLIIGATIASALSLAFNKLLIPINHLEAHIYTPFIFKKLKLPFLCLLITGGNTLLIYSKKIFKYHILGKTKDDALGETIDKIGRSLKLKYPWAVSLEKIAKLGKYKYNFPIPMIKYKNLNFSFSGLKTKVLNTINNLKLSLNKIEKANIAKSFLITIINTLIIKLNWALQQKKNKLILIVGGVINNYMIKNNIKSFFKKKKIKILYPKKELSTDNAVMIAYLAFLKIKNKNNEKIFLNNKDLYINNNFYL